VAGVDVSPDALAVAGDNAQRTGAVRNLRLLEGSLFAPVPGERFDLITANAPYIPSGELAELPLDVRGFEPHLALDGGADGLDLVREIASQAPRHLTPGGLLALEIGADQGARTIEILQERGYVDVQLARDLGGRDRVVSGYGPP
jgi:release factor glutamine methyltransferase